MKRLLFTFMSLFVIVFLSACGGNTSTHKGTQTEHLYSFKEASAVLKGYGYSVSSESDVVSKDGYYSCKATLQPQHYTFLDINGYVNFSARYSPGTGWTCNIDPHIEYSWTVSGRWYAETEEYYVYLDVVDFDGTTLHANIEAQYDSTEGGRGSYGPFEKNVALTLIDDDFRQTGNIDDIWLSCEIACGYPVFDLRIEKDSMTIWQLYDSFHAELIKK